MPVSHQIKFEYEVETELIAGLCPVSGEDDSFGDNINKRGLQS